MLPETLCGKLPQIQILLNYPLLDGGKKMGFLILTWTAGELSATFT